MWVRTGKGGGDRLDDRTGRRAASSRVQYTSSRLLARLKSGTLLPRRLQQRGLWLPRLGEHPAEERRTPIREARTRVPKPGSLTPNPIKLTPSKRHQHERSAFRNFEFIAIEVGLRVRH